MKNYPKHIKNTLHSVIRDMSQHPKDFCRCPCTDFTRGRKLSFEKLLDEHNMRRIRFHDLRHSCASLLIANGVGLKDIQAWLGHSTISTTVNIYVHQEFASKINSTNAILQILPGQKSEAVEVS